ncbi:SET domain containing protein [Cryptosporidium tyzzeri]|nr:SET domain containing protein [Cryptosporidium tyzzeri]
MAKKNDKNKKKRYIEWLKEVEKDSRKRAEVNAMKRQSMKSKTENIINGQKDVCMNIVKVKKKNVKLDRKGQKRLNKLSGIKKSNTSMDL